MTKTVLGIAVVAVTVLVVDGSGQLDAQRAAPQADDIRITSAIFGAAEGSADVTPIVTKLVSGAGEFLAAPRFLRVDPLRGTSKSLVIQYEYKGKPHVFTTTEPGLVSHQILVEHATGVRPAAPAAGSDELQIVNSFYGPYARDPAYLPVTAKLRELLRPDATPFVITDTVLDATPGTGPKSLVVIYLYKGIRSAYYAERDQEISYTMLVANPEPGGPPDKHSPLLPAWWKDAQPDPPLGPDELGPGLGPSPRRELGIAALLKAVAELKAIAPMENESGHVAKAIALLQQAVADAQASARAGSPPLSSRPVLPAVRVAPNSVRLANATRLMNVAIEELSQANPGRGGNALAKSIQEIRLALAELGGGGNRTE